MVKLHTFASAELEYYGAICQLWLGLLLNIFHNAKEASMLMYVIYQSTPTH